jgi:hypothetical protein
MTRVPMRTIAACFAACLLAGLTAAHGADPQVVDPTPSRQTLEDASSDNCAGVSVVVQRCADKPSGPTAKPADDALSRSRAQTKAAFDRRDKASRAAALKNPAPATTDAATGEAQQLGGVTVTGKATGVPPNVEEILQRALAPPTVSPDGTVSRYAPNGMRYDCIEKCIGPACCQEVRSLPNPARDVSSLNGH